jgi:hypothetical protein
MNFKIYLSGIILFQTIVGLSQQKLTIEESVIGQFRQFAPQTLEQINWMGKSGHLCLCQRKCSNVWQTEREIDGSETFFTRRTE